MFSPSIDFGKMQTESVSVKTMLVCHAVKMVWSFGRQVSSTRQLAICVGAQGRMDQESFIWVELDFEVTGAPKLGGFMCMRTISVQSFVALQSRFDVFGAFEFIVGYQGCEGLHSYLVRLEK